MNETAKRAGVFDEPEFDVTGFTPKTSIPAESTVPLETIKEVSEKARFQSREPASIVPKKPAKPARDKRPPRLHRTGRDVQFNAKCKPEIREAIYTIADQQGLKIAETLEQAVAALQEKIALQKSR